MTRAQTTLFDRLPGSGLRREAKVFALIGSKLEVIYDVPGDVPDAIGHLLRELDRKMGAGV